VIQAFNENDLWPGDCPELLIVGPPGTGKTHMVLTSYVWPVLDAGGTVLATSYTRAAAGELRDRSAKRFGCEPSEFKDQLSTIHSEAYRRCRHMGLRIRRNKDDSIEQEDIDRLGQLAALEAVRDGDYKAGWEIVRQVWPDDIGLSPRKRLSRLFQGVNLSEAERFVMMDLHGRYDEDGRLVNPDFTSLLELALQDGSGRKVDLLAVDESQDLTPLEWRLVDRWALDADRVLVVGDPDQAIYGWSGADGARLMRWVRDGRPARRLAKSWRVPSTAHALSRSVVRRVSDRIDAPYEPSERPGSVSVHWGPSVWATAQEAQEAGGTCLVLSRTNQGCTDAVADLLDLGIPHIAERGKPQILRPDGLSMRIASCLMDWLGRMVPTKSANARALIDSLSSRGPLLKGRRGLKTLMVKALSEMDGPVSVEWLHASGLDWRLMAEQFEEPADGWWESALLPRADADSIMAVRDWLIDYGDGDALMEAARRVVVVTAHGSKGREADVVIVDARKSVPMWSKRCDKGSLQTDRQRIDEDLRCLYVAVTRTKDRLEILRGGDGKPDWLGVHGIVVDRRA
jgi:DNA helicase II / ATP-dependent DNA helicase PcrA